MPLSSKTTTKATVIKDHHSYQSLSSKTTTLIRPLSSKTTTKATVFKDHHSYQSLSSKTTTLISHCNQRPPLLSCHCHQRPPLRPLSSKTTTKATVIKDHHSYQSLSSKTTTLISHCNQRPSLLSVTVIKDHHSYQSL